MSQETFSIQISEKSAQDKALKVLVAQGFIQDEEKSEYTLWRVRGDGIVAILYTSGKLVIQGKGASEIVDKLDLASGEQSQGADFTPHIGVDEVGKGDYFGPLVVAAAYISENDLDLLVSLGVGDSKKISDSKILKIGKELSNTLLYSKIVVAPSEYARLNRELGNVSIMLAKKHTEAVVELDHQLKDGGIDCKEVVFDQFSKRKDRLVTEMQNAGVKMSITQFHKGESDIAVAAASILARYHFLLEWEAMDKKYDFDFPKGSSQVIDAGRDFVSRFGAEKLKKVAKVSFKTTNKILQLF